MEYTTWVILGTGHNWAQVPCIFPLKMFYIDPNIVQRMHASKMFITNFTTLIILPAFKVIFLIIEFYYLIDSLRKCTKPVAIYIEVHTVSCTLSREISVQ